MSEMVRKQIYIKRRQQALLKRLAEERGLSEAEIVRQAIDREARHVVSSEVQSSQEAWENARKLMLELAALGPLENQPRLWKRDDAYEDRENRYAVRSD
jgi:hypothetical protein